MIDSYSTIHALPQAGEEIDALELAAEMAETVHIPESVAQKISQGLDALDGKADGLVAIDRYSDSREGSINRVIRWGLESHGISNTNSFLSVSHFANVLLNDTRDVAGLINREQFQDQITINLDKLGLVYDAALPQVLAEMVQNSEGRSDGLISTHSGERGCGRGNATVGQIEAMIQSEFPTSLGSSIAAAVASALDPSEEFAPPQNVPTAPGREGEDPSLNEEAVSFLLQSSSGLGSIRASVIDRSLLFIPEFTGINQELAALVKATGDQGLSSRLLAIYLSTGDSQSKIRCVPLHRLRLSAELEAEVRGILEWLVSVKKALDTQQNRLTPSEEEKLKTIVERLSVIRPALLQAVENYRSSFPPQRALAAVAPAAQVLEREAAQVGQYSNRFGPYGKPLLIGTAVLLVAAGIAYGVSSLTQEDEEDKTK